MRTLMAGMMAGLALIGGCTSTGSDGTGAATTSFMLSDGTYVGTFPRTACGTMVINGGGNSISYTAGPCGGTPAFRSAGSFDGKTIRIMEATYRLSSATESALTGMWTLGSYTGRITFKRQ